MPVWPAAACVRFLHSLRLNQPCPVTGASAEAFNAASYSFFESAPTSAAEVLEELEPGKSSIDAEVTSEAGAEPESEDSSARPAWA